MFNALKTAAVVLAVATPLPVFVQLFPPAENKQAEQEHAEPAQPAVVKDDFAISKDTQLAIVRIWSVMYDDEQYGHLFVKDRSMADAVFAYLIARDNELTIKNDRYRRSAIYDRPGPLPEDGIVPGGQ